MSHVYVDWQTEPEPSDRPYSDSGLLALFRGPDAAPRVARVRRALSKALDNWWRHGEMPPRGLLRDGLLLLEADHELDDAARSLLLRAALYYGRGMQTALRHQRDPERSAELIADMLLRPQRPISPAQVRTLMDADPAGRAWQAPLYSILQRESGMSLEPRRTLAAAALEYLSNEDEELDWSPLSDYDAPRSAPGAARPPIRLSTARARALARVLWTLALLLLLLSAAFLWQDLQTASSRTASMQSMPGGVYALAPEESDLPPRLVSLRSFAIDRTEVTNRAYRLCYEAGGCTWPARTTSITRPDYFLHPDLDAFPMVNVTWAQASAYCQWLGKRLPLAVEWEVAAGSALELERSYLFPWGDFFDPALANSEASTIGDTLPVGSFSPGGDSPNGAADMAGNASEWTASTFVIDPPVPNLYVVKGGSFQDDPSGLLVAGETAVEGNRHFPWLGFRCAVTQPILN